MLNKSDRGDLFEWMTREVESERIPLSSATRQRFAGELSLKQQEIAWLEDQVLGKSSTVSFEWT